MGRKPSGFVSGFGGPSPFWVHMSSSSQLLSCSALLTLVVACAQAAPRAAQPGSTAASSEPAPALDRGKSGETLVGGESIAAKPSEGSAPAGQELAFAAGESREHVATPTAHEQGLMRRMERDTSSAGERPALPRVCAENAAPKADELASSKTPEPCFPPEAFVERLCKATHPSVALVMFSKASPWKRGYLRGETKAWTTAPGAQANDRLAQDEEVLVLQADASAAAGIQYDAGASFYALRWDGSCVKLTQEEMLQTVPWGKKTPLVPFGYLDDGQQQSLRADSKIDAAYLAQRKACRAAEREDDTCSQATKRLSDLVVAFVRDGRELPDPAHRP